MKGLILKDLLNLKGSIRSLSFIFLFYIVFSIASGNFNFMSGMVILLCTMLTFTTFSYDEYTKWDRYALSTPVSRRMLVLGKYVLSLILILIGAGISLFALLGTSVIKQDPTALSGENLLTIALVTGVSIFFISILLPAIFKFGVEKGRLLLFVIIGIPSVILYLLYLAKVPIPSEDQLFTWIKFSPILFILCFLLSYFLSCRIYLKKDL